MTGPLSPDEPVGGAVPADPAPAERLPDAAPADAEPRPYEQAHVETPSEPELPPSTHAEPEQQPDQQVPLDQLTAHPAPAVPPSTSTWPLPPTLPAAPPVPVEASPPAPELPQADAAPATVPPQPPPLPPAPAASPEPAPPAALLPEAVPAAVPAVAVQEQVQEPVEEPVQDAAEESRPSVARGVLVPVLAALVVVLLGLTGFLGWKAADTAGAPAVETSRTQALASARDAARAVFSYDYRHLTKDFAAGKAVTTGTFADQYAGTTAKLLDFAVKNKATVAADVSDASVVRASDNEVVCLVFLNQTSSSSAVATPRITQSRLEMTMKRRGGAWLVAAINAL